MKRFTVMSRKDASKYSFGAINEKTIIVSITDVGSRDNTFGKNSNIVGICRVKFDDVEKGEKNCITSADAKKILTFMERHKDINNVIVHCEAGISRSAGACAALMLIYTGSDMDIFMTARFTPNMTVYRTILNEYHGISDTWTFPEEGEITKREEINLALWKQLNEI